MRYEGLLNELAALLASEEPKKPAERSGCVRIRKVDRDGALEELLNFLTGDDEDEEEETAGKEAAPEEKPAEKPVEDTPPADAEAHAAAYVGGLVVGATPIEDDGDRYYLCMADDSEFYLPACLFEKYFVKL